MEERPEGRRESEGVWEGLTKKIRGLDNTGTDYGNREKGVVGLRGSDTGPNVSVFRRCQGTRRFWKYEEGGTGKGKRSESVCGGKNSSVDSRDFL